MQTIALKILFEFQYLLATTPVIDEKTKEIGFFEGLLAKLLKWFDVKDVETYEDMRVWFQEAVVNGFLTELLSGLGALALICGLVWYWLNYGWAK